MKIKELISITVILFSILFFLFIFRINISDSMPYGIYLRVPAWRINRGDIVEFRNPMYSTLWGVNSTHNTIIKKVYEIKDDLYYLKGESKFAYDSRYFGGLGKDFVLFKVVPVITFKTVPQIIVKASDFGKKL